MAHRTPGRGNFTLHTMHAERPAKQRRDRDVRNTAHNPNELGRICILLAGVSPPMVLYRAPGVWDGRRRPVPGVPADRRRLSDGARRTGAGTGLEWGVLAGAMFCMGVKPPQLLSRTRESTLDA